MRDDESPLPPLEPGDVDPDDARNLWRAVIANAWSDAFVRSDTNLKNIDRRTEAAAVRSLARNWLVSQIEPWASDRAYVCDLAGIEPDALRLLARRRIEAGRADDAEREEETRRQVVERLDAHLESLVEVSRSLSTRQVDQWLSELAETELAEFGAA